MFEIIYMKADYEPWWMFEEWEDWVESKQAYRSLEEATARFQEIIEEWRQKHEFFEVRKGCFAAFWTKAEQCFCDHCDDDLQIFHGFILMQEGKPIVKEC